ncbi:MAG: hypothetical protein ACFE8F_11860 [Promethearchaeota archaeon]
MKDWIQSAAHPDADPSQPASPQGPGLLGRRYVHLNRQATLTIPTSAPNFTPTANRPNNTGPVATYATQATTPNTG